ANGERRSGQAPSVKPCAVGGDQHRTRGAGQPEQALACLSIPNEKAVPAAAEEELPIWMKSQTQDAFIMAFECAHRFAPPPVPKGHLVADFHCWSGNVDQWKGLVIHREQ